jgi:beta-glucosidase
MPFPANFAWGAATASYQIEGAVHEDGRGESIWDRFSHLPGKVMNGNHGDTACDHYHHYPQDVQLMRELGLKAYRFSIAWPRIIPTGTGQVNQKGLDFYRRLVDELLKANITPFVTLYHWDLPQALQDRGGWMNPHSPAWFGDYTEVVTKALGDRVQHWITHNEPWVATFLGHWWGVHAPGITDLRAAYSAGHHILLSHGQAVPVIRQHSPTSQVGITLYFCPMDSASESAQDQAAALREDGYLNRWFVNAVYKGEYPADLVEHLGPLLGHIDLGAVKAAAQPIDFLGVNFYTRNLIAHDEVAWPFQSRQVRAKGAEHTAMDWEVHPDALRRLLVWLNQTYDPKQLYITENGSAYDDPAPVNGVVEDPQRVAYLNQHLAAVEQAIDSGVPVRGYFAWSLLDNFEWAFGYEKRFGLYYVDYASQARIPKRSALRYREIIANGGL